MAVCLTVAIDTDNPGPALQQFTDIQRGIIFIWMLIAFVVMIITGLRLVAGNIDSQDKKYSQNHQYGNSQSIQNFDKVIIDNQKIDEADKAPVKAGKVTSKFQTMLLPLAVTFVLSLNLGVTYAFCFVLFFLNLIPLVLFNLAGFHKKFLSHKVIRGIAENLYLIGTFFWLVNIWTTGRFIEPYYMRNC